MWCPGPELNRYVSFETRDFKSRASASFATRADRKGFEVNISVHAAGFRKRTHSSWQRLICEQKVSGVLGDNMQVVPAHKFFQVRHVRAVGQKVLPGISHP
jgi:hypothetical protein